MILDAKNIYKYFSGELILEDISLKIENNDRIALIGANGCGKTTFLNIISRELGYDEGEIFYGSTSIGYLKQNTAIVSELTIYEEMCTVFTDLLEEEKRLQSIYSEMSSETDEQRLKELNREYSRLQTDFEHKDGYNINVKIENVLNGMGFLKRDFNTKISVLSGGEKTRLALAKLLLTEPDMLILDEPTNHLDFNALNWLESYLSTYKGALLLVSHDRYFLDRTTNDTAEIYKGKLKRYKGSYSKFVELKKQQIQYLTKEYEKQQNEIASLTEYIEKNHARASTAKSARSRENALERMEIIENPKEYLKQIHLNFQYDIEPVSELLFSDISELYAGDKLLNKNITFNVRRGEKIAIVGGNGTGKTTFLKALIGKSHYEGKVKWGRNAKISYFDQEAGDLKPNSSVMDEISRKYPGKNNFEIRSALGKLNLIDEDVHKNISFLSGGELAKVKFAIMELNRGNILILDEPTNHLDLSAKEVLDEALINFEGTIIAVSHDRYLLNRMPDAIYELTPDGFVKYPGKYDYYLEHKISDRKPAEKKEPATKDSYYRSKKERAEMVKSAKALKKVEEEIENTEQKIAELEEEIASPEVASDYQLLNEKCELIQTLKDSLTNLYEEWESLS